MKSDVYAEVTKKIIADLEKGELTWLRPWNAGYTQAASHGPCVTTDFPMAASIV